MTTYSPDFRFPRDLSIVMFSHRMENSPPLGIASLALTARLINADCNSVGSTYAGQISPTDVMCIWTRSLRDIRIRDASCSSQSLTSTNSSRSGCLRATLSSRLAKTSAEAEARSTATTSFSNPLNSLRRASSMFALTTMRRLLKSCATLATRFPSAPIRFNWRLVASADKRIPNSAFQLSHAVRSRFRRLKLNKTKNQIPTQGTSVATAINPSCLSHL
ncbi:hypothetical protein AWB74_08764 [Caballeronia arvi]|uniref:Uncharacterized protein n=1 Tax=Caballeronia arvi TaxID=1777135 RepID=A0A158L668_9BURK|nr:hypothetical protein AWB74_08764 [Caballeronia arvi]